MIAAVFDRLTFAHPWALAGLLLVPPAIWLLGRRRARMPRIVVPAAPVGLKPSRWARIWWLPGGLVIAALALTSLGLAGPRLRTSRRIDLSVQGIDIVVAFDLSTSMLAADFRPAINFIEMADAHRYQVPVAGRIAGAITARILLATFLARTITAWLFAARD